MSESQPMNDFNVKWEFAGLYINNDSVRVHEVERAIEYLKNN